MRVRDHSAYNLAYYRVNRNAERRRVSERARKVREYTQRIKTETPCADCSEQYPHYVMEFDHRDSLQKTLEVTRLVGRVGIDRLKAEIAKCDVVCSNCHAIRTWMRRQQAAIA